MNTKNIGGVLALVAGTILIGLAIWVTKSAGPLWAFVLLIWFAQDFPWHPDRPSPPAPPGNKN